MRLYGRYLLKISHQVDKFIDHRDCGSADIMILDCHVILQDHVTKGSSNIMDKKVLKLCYHPAKFGAKRRCGIEDKTVSVCHVISHVIKE